MDRLLVKAAALMVAFTGFGRVPAALAQPVLDPANPPRLFGIAEVNKRLNCTPIKGYSAEQAVAKIEWLRKTTPQDQAEVISVPAAEGASEAVYLPGDEDLGKYLGCRHTLQSDTGAASAVSDFVGPIAADSDIDPLAGAPVQLAPPFFSGAPLRAWDWITCYPGVWQGVPVFSMFDFALLKSAALDASPEKVSGPAGSPDSFDHPIKRSEQGYFFSCRVGLTDPSPRAPSQFLAETDLIGPVEAPAIIRFSQVSGACAPAGCSLTGQLQDDGKSGGLMALKGWLYRRFGKPQQRFAGPLVKPFPENGLVTFALGRLQRGRSYTFYFDAYGKDFTAPHSKYVYRLKRGQGASLRIVPKSASRGL